MVSTAKIGVVVIGRNEGDRLIRSLDSVVNGSHTVVYVDSGSTDGSCEAARDRGVEVVNLDRSVPFTAARARNAGFKRLQNLQPDIEYVQFIDGDCEVVPGWMEAATTVLDTHPDVVAVCGWRRERYPERSVFNRICDVEWRICPVGENLAFGGDVLIRAKSLAAVGGYDPIVIAGEEHELAVRLRQQGGRILRIDQVNTLHDADMHHFSQWWNRAKRCGYAYSLVASMHGAPPEHKFVREVRRTWLWGFIMPLTALVLMPLTNGFSLLILARYPLTALKTIYNTHRQGISWGDSIAWGLSCSISAFPEVTGAIKFQLNRLQNRQHEIIEYKGPRVEG